MIHRTLLILGLAGMLVACNSSPTRTSTASLSPEDAVAQRATERWRHIIAKDFRKAYDYLTTATRLILPSDQYAARMGQAQIKWEDMTGVQVTCEDEETCKAQVELSILVTVPMAGSIETKTYVYEDWLKSSDQWYLLLVD